MDYNSSSSSNKEAGASIKDYTDKTQAKIRKIKNEENEERNRIEELKLDLTFVSVGTVESIFNKKNGTPRQSGICPQSKGIIRLHKRLFNNPMHALEGIEQFVYVWILYYFHENTNKRRFIAKVHPPRLNGTSCGVFASRAPHRPNPVGLTLAKIENVKDDLLYVSGIDIIDGTPIIDIKPYIEKYDYPFVDKALFPNYTLTTLQEEYNLTQRSESDDNHSDCHKQEKNRKDLPSNMVADWVNGSVVSDVKVEFTSRSLKQLSRFHPRSIHHELSDCDKLCCDYCFRMFTTEHEAKSAIVNLLNADPRSVYRRNKCVDRLYFFTIDTIHITAWFDIENELVEVVKIKPYLVNK